MSKIYLIRHGETEWNREQRTQGRSNDIELAEEGIVQAERLSERLRNEKIDLFFSSGLKRAHKTASIIADLHNSPVEILNEFGEINFGCFEGLRFSEIKEKYGEVLSVWRESPHLAKIPYGETIIELKERALNKLFEIIKDNEDKNILIVSHGITIKVLVAALMGIDLGNIHKIRQDNTGLNIFEYKNGEFYLNLLNDTSHLSLKEERI